ncbi:MAG TPA: NUDIX domain-containing protein [Stellaceae bacterium]|nr:NUDIX domain-containing protein [Stellaceae bacterium]
MSNAPDIARWCAAALLVTPDGRYLMQLRDDKPTILLPGHWALFGGTVDAGETAAEAMRRELVEELEFAAADITAFSEMIVELPFAPPRFDRMSFFTVPITERQEQAMVQHEGAGRRLFTPEILARESRVAPWDLAAVLMHARRRSLFGR